MTLNVVTENRHHWHWFFIPLTFIPPVLNFKYISIGKDPSTKNWVRFYHLWTSPSRSLLCISSSSTMSITWPVSSSCLCHPVYIDINTLHKSLYTDIFRYIIYRYIHKQIYYIQITDIFIHWYIIYKSLYMHSNSKGPYFLCRVYLSPPSSILALFTNFFLPSKVLAAVQF